MVTGLFPGQPVIDLSPLLKNAHCAKYSPMDMESTADRVDRPVPVNRRFLVEHGDLSNRECVNCVDIANSYWRSTKLINMSR
jgi:hypothetical protein